MLSSTTSSSATAATIKKVARELQVIDAQPLEGIRLQYREEDLRELAAFILGPEGTPYAGGCFKVRMQFTADYPTAPPKCYFVTKIFHPNVSKAGEICVSTLKKDWKKELGIAHILLTIKCLLIVPNAESALNEDAGKLLLEAYDDYAARAKLMTSIHGSNRSEYDALAPKDEEKGGVAAAGSTATSTTTSPVKSGATVDGSTTATAMTNATTATDDQNRMENGEPSSLSSSTSGKRAATGEAGAGAAATSAAAKKKLDAKKRSLKRL